MRIDLKPHGPHSPDYTRKVAAAISEGVRVLNYATRKPNGLIYPADVYDVLGTLSAAALSLPQALGQMNAWLREEATAGRIGQDSSAAYRTTEHAAADTASRLREAAAAAVVLGEQLAAAQAAASGLHART